ncbi:MAG: bifunctional 3,4-dihydroxy-2-butanone-4-phosphate synthase/GTP cyclohydrolase II [Spirochaetes bacterium]|nr:bifunctional 3,4-dihydroxy-2-butanone-4-phosphate synthase/GTP cyclohydrolase II [Spirochaetota bacterium]
MTEKIKLDSIEEAIRDIKKGKMIIIVDSPDRENEGDLIMAAQKITPEAINFMSKYGRGLICVPLTPARVNFLKLEPMTRDNTDYYGTDFTVSVDARTGITTGISAHDRAHTIKLLVSPQTHGDDITKPGHIFPLKAKPGGVLERAGHTEASIDIARLAGLDPSGVICEIMQDDGTMARLPELVTMAKKFDLRIISIADLIHYRRKTEKLVEKVADAELPTKYGNFHLYVYEYKIDRSIHIALVKGKIKKNEPVLVRVHSECLTGDVFHSLRCDCGEQMDEAMKIIEKKGKGVIVYMRHHEGRGIGIVNKIKAYKFQQQGLDTVEANCALGFPADLRDYGVGAQILVDLKVGKIKLLTNNPRKIIGIKGYGLEIVQKVPIEVKPNKMNKKYLAAKKAKLGHTLTHV